MARWLLCGILVVICVFHVYWAFGGWAGRDKVTPTVNGKPLLRIGFAACLGMAWIFLLLAGVPVVAMNVTLRKWLLIGMIVAFSARAIGDFKYVGFFKSVKGTPFADWDTRMFSPLNVLLAVLAGLSL